MSHQTEKQESISSQATVVLLVDDQAIVGETVRRMLVGEPNIEFHFCNDPSKAIQTAAELLPTVILQDLVMPDIDGLTLVKFYRAHPKLRDIPVIILTSKADPQTKKELFEGGATDYLVKIPDKIELLARIDLHAKNYRILLQRNDNYDKLHKSQQALKAELDKAGKYCISLLPDQLDKGDVKTVWRFIPSEQLGGDSFGYHWIDSDHFAMYLLDVCGHGVGSALMSVSALNTLRTQTLPDTDFRDPAQVLTALNASFQMEDHNEMYFTLWYGVFNKSDRTIKFGSAGHPPAFLIHNGVSENLANQNFIIGGLPNFPYTSTTVNVPENSSLYIFSDGVYEITLEDESMWTLEGLSEFIVNNMQSDGAEIDILHKHVQQLSGSDILDDDFSMLRITF